MTIVTRFAPSPTGYLHIGGARTALFNYLFAKANKGRFLLRVEDTDKDRHKAESVDKILSSLEWLDLKWDGDVVFQSAIHDTHTKAALKLVEEGKAYYCFTSQGEIQRQRNLALEQKKHFIFHSEWRDADPSSYPKDLKPVVRIKAPRVGRTIIKDKLQGDVVIENDHLDDMVLLRSDGSPTYMLAVVVDDHNMGITHIIRGDDHLTNAARQILLYQAFGWEVPVMVHMPLIHGPDGAKLSKRHGALGVEHYKEMGYLPEALCNYLLRLGWSHGDDEIISRDRSIEWFNFEGLGKSPARLDFAKMKHVNGHYIRQKDDEILTKMIIDHLELESKISDISKNNIKQAISSIKTRGETINDIAEIAKIYVMEYEITYTEGAKTIIDNLEQSLIREAIDVLQTIEVFDKDIIQYSLKQLAEKHNIKLGELMQPIRALVVGSISSPSVFEIIAIIGKENTIKRLQKI